MGRITFNTIADVLGFGLNSRTLNYIPSGVYVVKLNVNVIWTMGKPL